MSTTDRKPVKPSAPNPASNRSNARQSARRQNEPKTNFAAGREPARQSPPLKPSAK